MEQDTNNETNSGKNTRENSAMPAAIAGIQASSLNDTAISQEDISNLSYAAKWSKFLGIIMFVMFGLMALGSIAILLASSSSMLQRLMSVSKGFMIVYFTFIIAILLIYFLLGKALFTFGTKTNTAFANGSPEDLTVAFISLRRFFAIAGILTLVILVIYAIMLVIGIFGSLMR